MHPNPAYRQTSRDDNLAFARARGFGILSVSAPEGPLLSHVPFVLDGDHVDLHLVRSNPIARLDGPVAGVIAVSGPHSYISPDWYGIADQVPTWNYVAVHLRGELAPLPDEALPVMLERLSAQFEAMLDKAPWTMAKMDQAALSRMMRMIRPMRLTIRDVQGTWKLTQNKVAAARLAAADHIAAEGIGDGLADLAALMRNVDSGGA